MCERRFKIVFLAEGIASTIFADPSIAAVVGSRCQERGDTTNRPALISGAERRRPLFCSSASTLIRALFAPLIFSYTERCVSASVRVPLRVAKGRDGGRLLSCSACSRRRVSGVVFL